MTEYLQFGDSDRFIADYWIVSSTEGFLAFGQIYAAFGRGDEMMRIVTEGFTRKAGELGGPIVHEFIATNARAKALVERTEGYVFSEKDHNGHPVYRKTFYP